MWHKRGYIYNYNNSDYTVCYCSWVLVQLQSESSLDLRTENPALRARGRCYRHGVCPRHTHRRLGALAIPECIRARPYAWPAPARPQAPFPVGGGSPGAFPGCMCRPNLSSGVSKQGTCRFPRLADATRHSRAVRYCPRAISRGSGVPRPMGYPASRHQI